MKITPIKPPVADSETELLAPDTPIPNIDDMDRADVPAIFAPMKQQVEALRHTAETLTVTSADDKPNMKLARDTRLALKEIRILIEKKRVELKEASLRRGQRIDAEANPLKTTITSLEKRLEEQEQFAVREAQRIEDERRAARTAEIAPFLTGPCPVDLGKMADADYAALLADSKDLHTVREQRKEAEAKAAAEKAQQEAEERERLRVEAEERRLEVERMRAEAAAKEAERLAELERMRLEQAERDKAERAAREAAERASREQLAAQAEKHRLEQAERDRIAKEAAAAAEEERRKEREAAAAERARLEAIAAEERKKAAAAQAERERIAKEAADKAAAEEAARRAAAAAPDRDKLNAWAASLMALDLPTLSDEHRETSMKIAAKRAQFAAWIEKLAAELGGAEQ